ncbi:MAG: pilus assembly protein [Anaerolineales bacterium]
MLRRTAKKAQGLTEYALILALVAVVVTLILYVLSPAVGNIWSNVRNNLINAL